MKTNLIIVLVVVAVLIIGGGIYFFTQQTKPATDNQAGTNNIEISGFAFSPATLTINVGESVTWTNNQNVPHTITSDSGTELSSSNLGNGQTYSHTFNAAGTYNYHCSIHSIMKGTIIVN